MYATQEQVKKELKGIPRGRRGSVQNWLRAVYCALRMKSLAGRLFGVYTPRAAFDAALAIVFRKHPGATLTYSTRVFGFVG